MMLPSPSKLKGTEGFTPTGACRQHPVHRIRCFLGKKIHHGTEKSKKCVMELKMEKRKQSSQRTTRIGIR